MPPKVHQPPARKRSSSPATPVHAPDQGSKQQPPQQRAEQQQQQEQQLMAGPAPLPKPHTSPCRYICSIYFIACMLASEVLLFVHTAYIDFGEVEHRMLQRNAKDPSAITTAMLGPRPFRPQYNAYGIEVQALEFWSCLAYVIKFTGFVLILDLFITGPILRRHVETGLVRGLAASAFFVPSPYPPPALHQQSDTGAVTIASFREFAAATGLCSPSLLQRLNYALHRLLSSVLLEQNTLIRSLRHVVHVLLVPSLGVLVACSYLIARHATFSSLSSWAMFYFGWKSVIRGYSFMFVALGWGIAPTSGYHKDG